MGIRSLRPRGSPTPVSCRQRQTLLPPVPAPRGCPPALLILLARGEAAGGFWPPLRPERCRPLAAGRFAARSVCCEGGKAAGGSAVAAMRGRGVTQRLWLRKHWRGGGGGLPPAPLPCEHGAWPRRGQGPGSGLGSLLFSSSSCGIPFLWEHWRGHAERVIGARGVPASHPAPPGAALTPVSWCGRCHPAGTGLGCAPASRVRGGVGRAVSGCSCTEGSALLCPVPLGLAASCLLPSAHRPVVISPRETSRPRVTRPLPRPAGARPADAGGEAVSGGGSVPRASQGAAAPRLLGRAAPAQSWGPPAGAVLQQERGQGAPGRGRGQLAVGALPGRVGPEELLRCLQPGPDPSPPKHPALGCGIIPRVKLAQGVSSPRCCQLRPAPGDPAAARGAL